MNKLVLTLIAMSLSTAVYADCGCTKGKKKNQEKETEPTCFMVEYNNCGCEDGVCLPKDE